MKKTENMQGLSLRGSVFGAVGASAIVFFGAFMVAFLASSNFAPAFDSSAAEINVSSSATGYYADITTLGTVEIGIEATPDGTAKIGKDVVTVNTNAKAGYKLYISTVSESEGNGLYLEDDSTQSIAASSGTTANPVALATNTWGYIPSRSNSSQTATEYTDADIASGTGSATVVGVPVYGSENVLYTNTTPTTDSTNTVDVYYGVNASTAIPSGTYSNTVVYTAIVDAVNTDSVDASIAPASQNGLVAGTPVTISTGLYPGFSAANMGEITVTIGGNACTGVTPVIAEAGNLNITCVAPAASTAGKKDVVVTVAKYGKTYTITEGYEYVQPIYMQDFVCDANLPNIGDELTLTDKRDDSRYTVRRLNDGKCWMVEDLKLGGDTDLVLTPELSNVSSNFTLKAENNITDSDGTGTGWCTVDSAACVDRSLMMKEGTTAPGGGTAPNNLYNWYAATAGTGTYAVSSGNATASICPKGWSLPTGGPSGDFAKLDIAYGGTGEKRTDAAQVAKLMSLENNGVGFNWTGGRVGNSVSNPSSWTFYWTRTALSDLEASRLTVYDSDYINPQGAGDKNVGLAVRCVAYDSMQRFSAAVHSSDATGTTYMLSDARDGKAYGAKKLADGNIWMMDNLELDLPYGESSRTLTPADSDVSSNWSLTDNSAGSPGWCDTDSAECDNQSLISRTGYSDGTNTALTYYYNWYTATAGSGTYSAASSDVSDSICPKGWKLPSMDQFVNLDKAYGGSGENRIDATQVTKFIDEVGFSPLGYRNSNQLNQLSTGANYWSRSADDITYVYDLDFRVNNSQFNPQDLNYKWRGFPIRCIKL